MDFSTWLVSVLRTSVPAAIGAALSWLAGVGLDAGAEANAGLVTFGTAFSIIVYYALVRAVEPKLPPWLRVLLIGANRQPDYGDLGAPAPTPTRYR